jgi:hypothetical protein
MALARVVSFDGVTKERMDELARRLETEDPPEDVPATEVLMLHDAEADSALAILLFDSEEDYARGDEALSAMPADDTPGTRTSVSKYTVAARRTR